MAPMTLDSAIAAHPALWDRMRQARSAHDANPTELTALRYWTFIEALAVVGNFDPAEIDRRLTP